MKDENAKAGRKQIVKSTREKLEDAIVDKPIRELKKLELDEWAHSLIREHNMTKTMYYNMSLIMRQCLDYAVDLEIVEDNQFRKVNVDGRRMFRKVRKKKDSTQVYSRDYLFQLLL